MCAKGFTKLGEILHDSDATGSAEDMSLRAGSGETSLVRLGPGGGEGDRRDQFQLAEIKSVMSLPAFGDSAAILRKAVTGMA